jgi:hypothetical protein
MKETGSHDSQLGVICLAAEEEMRHEAVSDLFRPLDGGEGKGVDVGRPLIEPERGIRQ